MENVILIGMPGAGKSTAGVILAKVLGYNFVDTDLLIQEKENRLLKDIIAEEGLEEFLAIENEVNQTINTKKSVIATGGSVVYGKEAMKHLREIGTVVYIQLGYETLNSRLDNIEQRGVVLKKGQDLNMLYKERCPLYEKNAHVTVNAEGMDVEQLVTHIKSAISNRNTNN